MYRKTFPPPRDQFSHRVSLKTIMTSSSERPSFTAAAMMDSAICFFCLRVLPRCLLCGG